MYFYKPVVSEIRVGVFVVLKNEKNLTKDTDFGNIIGKCSCTGEESFTNNKKNANFTSCKTGLNRRPYFNRHYATR